MAHKDKDKVYINIDPNKITQQLKDHELIVIAPKKKKKRTPEPMAKPRKKLTAFKGGGRAYGKNS